MASDEAIREGSRAWSGGWLSHRLAAAQHLACELSDDVNTVFSIQAQECQRAFRSQSPQQSPSRGSVDRRPCARPSSSPASLPCRAVPRAPCPVPCAVPEPLSLDSRALASIRPEWPFTTYFFFISVTLPLTLYRLNISPIVRARASLLSTGPTPAPVPISLLFLSLSSSRKKFRDKCINII
ncbi:hypothetical protein TYRP_003596 [Tyrophagus putrescentiae]|nr:hypothetical protein TYRP_003596 [Tyrophagus putrescentiae]